MENVPANANWQCPNCGTANSNQGQFCAKCGFNPFSQKEPGKKPMAWKIILLGVLCVVLAVGGFVGYRQWKKIQAEKKAKIYLEVQQRLFSDSVAAINGISSETDLDVKYSDEDNSSLIEEKMREEKVKAEAAADTIDKVVKSSAQAESNELVAGLDGLIDDYLKEAYKVTGKYQDFMRYKHDEARANVEIESIWKAYDDRHKLEPNNLSELKGAFLDKKSTIEKEIAQREGVEYPEGLSEVYRRGIEELRKYAQLFQDGADAIDRKDEKRFVSIFEDGGELDSGLVNLREAIGKINSMSKDYFSQMHDEFVSLRGKADRIKSEFLTVGVQYGVQPPSYSIEGW